MIGYMLHRLPAINRPVDRQSDGGPGPRLLSLFLSAVELIGYRRVALRGYRLLWVAAAPFYVAAMLVNLIWACLWMPDLKPDTDADALGWESDALSVSQLNSQRAEHLAANPAPSIN